MRATIYFALIPIGIVVGFLLISYSANKDNGNKRLTANCLVVLTGILAALAIFIPLGATLLPEPKNFHWPAWCLIGALASGVVCLFGIVYSMIVLQDANEFVIKDKIYVPNSINSSWGALAVLAITSVLIKMPFDEISEEAPITTNIRFAVARELPLLGAGKGMVLSTWGTPLQENAFGVRYQLKDSSIIFCLDSKGITKSITEIQEGDINAISKICKAN